MATGSKGKANVSRNAGGLPLVTDVSFRINDAGDFFAVDFTCADGEVRGVALPVASLSNLVAGVLWTATQAARRRPAAPLDPQVAQDLCARAPAVAAATASPAGGGEVLLALEVGAAGVALRLAPGLALDVAEKLVEALQRPVRGPLG